MKAEGRKGEECNEGGEGRNQEEYKAEGEEGRRMQRIRRRKGSRKT